MKSKDSEWKQLIKIEDEDWIKQVRMIMEQYTDKTGESFIEEKKSYINWNFENCNYMFGILQANEMLKCLETVFAQLPIMIYMTQFTVCCRPLEHQQDKLIKTLLSQEIPKLENKDEIDFMLYLGNDSSNEKNFIYLNKVLRKQ